MAESSPWERTHFLLYNYDSSILREEGLLHRLFGITPQYEHAGEDVTYMFLTERPLERFLRKISINEKASRRLYKADLVLGV